MSPPSSQATVSALPRHFLGLRQIPEDLTPTVVTIGMFDGVHRGHRALLGRVVQEATARGLPPAAITFDRHPAEVLRPGSHPRLLTTLRQKVALLRETGVAEVLVLPFTLELSRVPAEEFAERVLFGAMRARVAVVGANFRFGHKAAGDVALLTDLGQRRGVEVIGVPLQAAAGEVVSSTRIRAALAGGDVQEAARLLGRPFTLEGHVVQGHRRGRLLGIPTANLAVPTRLQIPAIGIYAGHLETEGLGWLPAVTSVGVRPQFGGTELSVETYVLDFEGDLYGRRVSVSFEHRLRGQATFPSVADLVAQMQEDVRQARHLLGMTGR
jgi:riboflavin kinase/FMN adenylyltransferase